MKPRVHSIDGLFQLCYDLPHHVYTSKTYPLRSPNQSTIIVYGHQHGLRVVWTGGLPLKHRPIKSPDRSYSNGSNDAIMIIDSDDEEPAPRSEPHVEEAEFEDDEEEYDPSAPYDQVIQTLDLLLGSAVLHLAFPHLPADIHHIDATSLPTLFSEKLVVAVACSDCSIRVVTLPLAPPSHESKARSEVRNATYILNSRKSLFGEQMVILPVSRHQNAPKGISLTFTNRNLKEVHDVDMEDGDNADEDMDLQQRTSHTKEGEWDLLVASHSADLSGILLVHRVPFKADGSVDAAELWRTQFLPSPAVSVQFSSALYPDPEHCQILLAEAKGVVRIIDYFKRASQRSWVHSLFTGFDGSTTGLPKRKTILDAQWLLGGKSILVLLSNGEWGVWDIAHVQPKPQPVAGVTDKPPNPLAFSLDGRIDKTSGMKVSMKSAASNERSKLAPMTPGTRKMRQDVLFSSPAAPPEKRVHGGLCVIPASGTASGRGDDDSVLLWHGDYIMTIPSFYSYWQNQIRGSGGLFRSGAKGEARIINNIKLGGESRAEVSLMPPHPRSRTPGREPDQLQVLVTAEHRIVVVTPPLLPPRPAQSSSQPFVSPSTDLQLLARGELDVNGMDRILAGMSNGGRTPRPESATPRQAKARKLLSS